MNKTGASNPPYDKDLKASVLRKVRDEGMSVTGASQQFGVTSKSIYRWLKEGVVDNNRNLVLENNKLKKELEIAYRIIGRFTAEAQRSKD